MTRLSDDLAGWVEGARRAAAAAREDAVPLVLGLTVLVPGAMMVADAATRADHGGIEAALQLAGASLALGLVARRGSREPTPAQATAAALRRDLDGRGDKVLLRAFLDGALVREVVVPDAARVPWPTRRERVLPVTVLTRSLGPRGEVTSTRERREFAGDGTMRVVVDVEGWIEVVTLDAAVPVVREWRRPRAGRADGAGGRGRWSRAKPPAGVDTRAAEALRDFDIATREDVGVARRAVARRLHPDRPGGDAALLSEVNAALDLYEARLAATPSTSGRGA